MDSIVFSIDGPGGTSRNSFYFEIFYNIHFLLFRRRKVDIECVIIIIIIVIVTFIIINIRLDFSFLYGTSACLGPWSPKS
jgi:hypothetical protein